jgi:hypothetical protein
MRVMEKKVGSGEGEKGGVFELWERSEERGVLDKGVPGVEESWDCCEGPGQVRRATVSKWRFRESVVPRVDYTVLEQTDDWSSRVALLRWRSFCEKQNVQCKDKLCFEDQRHFMASLLDHIEANSGIDEVYFDEEPWGEQANSSDIRTYIRGFNLGTAAQVRSFIMKNTSALQQNALEIKPLQQPCHFDSPDSVLLVDCKGWNSTTVHCLMSVLGEVNRVSQTRQGVFYVRYSDIRVLTWSKLLSKCLASEFFSSRKSLLTNSTADFLASSPMILIPNTRSANYVLYFLHSNDKYFRKGEIKTSTIVSSSKHFKQATNKKVTRSIERQSSISSQSTAISYQTSVQPVKLDDLLSTSRYERQPIVLDILSLKNSMPVINPLTTRAPVFTK